MCDTCLTFCCHGNVSSERSWTSSVSKNVFVTAVSHQRAEELQLTLTGLLYPEFIRAKEAEARLYLPTPAESWESAVTEKKTGRTQSEQKNVAISRISVTHFTEPFWSGPMWSRFSQRSPGTWIHLRLTEDFLSFTWSRKWEQEEPTADMVSQTSLDGWLLILILVLVLLFFRVLVLVLVLLGCTEPLQDQIFTV